jgi:hypothetical protein
MGKPVVSKTENIAPKKLYVSPNLVRYGDLAAVTATKGQNMTDANITKFSNT